MAYEVSGKIVAIYDTVNRTETFRTREFAIEKSEEINGKLITNFVKFQMVQDKTALLDKVKVGEEVKVHFNLKGTKWVKDGKESYFTNLDAWRIESQLSASPAPVPPSDFDINQTQFSENDNDLPF